MGAYDGWHLVPSRRSRLIPFLLIPRVGVKRNHAPLVRVFPARRTRDILSVIAVLAAGGLVLLFRMVRPEQLARPEGFRSLVDFIAVLKTPTSPFLPSEWVQRAVMSSLLGIPDALPYYLLWSTAAAFVVLGALLHRSLYTTVHQGAGEAAAVGGGTRLKRLGMAVLAPFGTVRRSSS